MEWTAENNKATINGLLDNYADLLAVYREFVHQNLDAEAADKTEGTSDAQVTGDDDRYSLETVVVCVSRLRWEYAPSPRRCHAVPRGTSRSS